MNESYNEIRNRMQELVTLLNQANLSYEQKNVEIMSNFTYDKLYDELKKLEEDSGVILADSPTQKVGYEVVSELEKERHEKPMLSLDKTKDPVALADWLGANKGLLSWKMDGLTVVLTYEEGQLVKAVTRGNGEIGEVITQNAKHFKNLPLTIPFKGKLILRGEAVISYAAFEKINETIGDADAKYKNPRNLCSGSVRQLDSKVTASRNVNVFIFALVQMEGMNFKFRHQEFEYLRELGFEVVEERAVDQKNIQEEIINFKNKIVTNEYPSDGLVLILDDIAYGESLGLTSKFPRNAIAFKWQDEEAETTLREIEWSPSRTGLINPVAIFDPVELEGTTVSRASVHNVSVMQELGLGIGDKIKVYKANMIIPQISENLTRSGNVSVPERCPLCGQETRLQDDDGVKVLYCTNPGCAAKKIKSFALFTSRDAFNIEGLSEATLEKLAEHHVIATYSDIFSLKYHRNTIVDMKGFGEKSYKKLQEAAEKAKKITPEKFIYSLGIPNIGLSTAKLIVKEYGSNIRKLLNLNAMELSSVEGIGDVIAEAYEEFFRKPSNIKLVNDLLYRAKVEIIESPLSAGEKLAEGGASLAGITAVITGSLNHFGNRSELKDIIENAGGKVTGSVTKKTDFLINNDITSNSSKNQKAKELGVEIISEDDFIKKFSINV